MLKPISGYEGLYMVSDTGKIISCERFGSDGRFISEKEIFGGHYPNGYQFVCLRKDGINRNILVHRLVAQAFISNPNNLPVVNHIDRDKTNNRVSNLEWCTQRYNLKHAINIGLIENQCKIRRKVTVKQGEHIILFDTMKDCATYFGFQKGWVQNQIRKHGCKFNYEDCEIEVHRKGE